MINKNNNVNYSYLNNFENKITPPTNLDLNDNTVITIDGHKVKYNDKKLSYEARNRQNNLIKTQLQRKNIQKQFYNNFINEINKHTDENDILNYLKTLPNDLTASNDNCPLIGFSYNDKDPKIFSQFAELNNTHIINPSFKSIDACNKLNDLIEVSEFNKKIATVNDVASKKINNLYYFNKNVGGKTITGLACGTNSGDIGTINCCSNKSDVIELKAGATCNEDKCELQCLEESSDVYYCNIDKGNYTCSATKPTNLMFRNQETCESLCKVPDLGKCTNEDCGNNGTLIDPNARRPDCTCICKGEGTGGSHYQDTDPHKYCTSKTRGNIPGCPESIYDDHPNYETIKTRTIEAIAPLTGKQFDYTSPIHCGFHNDCWGPGTTTAPFGAGSNCCFPSEPDRAGGDYPDCPTWPCFSCTTCGKCPHS